MEFLAILLFALAVSTDGFLVGLAYGVKKIKIPLGSLLLIAFASALAVTISMICGKGLAVMLPPALTGKIGAVLIFLIALYFLMQACRSRLEEMAGDEREPLMAFSIKPLGIIIQILREPSSADFDSSGEISLREAFFLGFALAVDALGAGVGMAMAGYDIFCTALMVAVLKLILVSGGMLLGKIMANRTWQSLLSWLPVIILMVIAAREFF
ncbi:MAG: sporulation membrane protein YtaF [Deltaproteobacteria bacterium]